MTLSEWLLETNTTQREFADRLGVHQTAVSQWVKGRTRPTLDRIAQIETATRRKVRLADWLPDSSVKAA